VRLTGARLTTRLAGARRVVDRSVRLAAAVFSDARLCVLCALIALSELSRRCAFFFATNTFLWDTPLADLTEVLRLRLPPSKIGATDLVARLCTLLRTGAADAVANRFRLTILLLTGATADATLRRLTTLLATTLLRVGAVADATLRRLTTLRRGAALRLVDAVFNADVLRLRLPPSIKPPSYRLRCDRLRPPVYWSLSATVVLMFY
jgi:hypothetical protein